ncbi:cytochrome P450 [Suillus subluteus]|nr:cytochrome P450 [Suillus subluteus]
MPTQCCLFGTAVGFPHRVTEDDIHDGYYIPKGSLIVPNVWFMLNDPRTYANPTQFNPERFLAKDGKEPEMEPRTVCFGFGRRCAQLTSVDRQAANFLLTGLHLADASIWISTAMSLAVFDISKVVEHGVEITPEVDSLPGSASALSDLALQLPLGSLNKTLTTKFTMLVQQLPIFACSRGLKCPAGPEAEVEASVNDTYQPVLT